MYKIIYMFVLVFSMSIYSNETVEMTQDSVMRSVSIPEIPVNIPKDTLLQHIELAQTLAAPGSSEIVSGIFMTGGALVSGIILLVDANRSHTIKSAYGDTSFTRGWQLYDTGLLCLDIGVLIAGVSHLNKVIAYNYKNNPTTLSKPQGYKGSSKGAISGGIVAGSFLVLVIMIMLSNKE
jgi:hypothetical protein